MSISNQKQKIKMKNQHFFMVFLDGGNNPTIRHSTLVLAEMEAKRLAKAHGKRAFVLCSLKSYEILEFKETDCRPEIEDLPF